MTALDDRPTTTPLPPANHPDSPSRLAETARWSRLLPEHDGFSISTAWLPTCDGARCFRDQQAGVWVHSAECDRRNRDGEFAAHADARTVREQRKSLHRSPSAYAARQISWAEDTLRGAHDEVWRERYEAQARVRRAVGQP